MLTGRAQLLHLRAEILLNVPHDSNTVWFCFKDIPTLETQIVPMFKSQDLNPQLVMDSLIFKMSELAVERLKALVVRNLVFPNMENVSIHFLDKFAVPIHLQNTT